MGLQSALALALCFIASALFGSQFVPMRRFAPHDGFFAQWIMCVSVWFVGFGMFIWTGYHNFYPAAMLGGMAWSSANLMSIPIISTIGLGRAVLLNSVTQCVVSFCVSTFGLFGTAARPADMMWMTVLGLTVVLIGGVLTSFVKGKPSDRLEHTQITKVQSVHPIATDITDKNIMDRHSISIMHPTHFYITNHKLRVIATLACLVQGCMAAMTIVPVVAIQDNPHMFEGVETGGMPYVFSLYCGIFGTSTLAFIIYAIIRKNKPFVSNDLILPSIVSGLMWGVGMVMMLVATEALSQSITGPITAMVPGCVASMWSLLYFKEIETGKNLYYLCAAMLCTMAGAILIGLSKF